MTKPPFSYVILSVTILTLLSFILSSPFLTHALGSGSTLSIISATSTVCGVVSSQPTQSITCYRRLPLEENVTVQPNISFSSISGGSTFFCGLRSGGYAFLCWDTRNFKSQRVYINNTVVLQNLSVGDDQVCAIVNDTSNVNKTGTVKCWRGDGNISNQLPSEDDKYKSISSGFGFSCGILMESNRIKCWGNGTIARGIELGFGDMEMLSLEAGGLHVCGLNSSGLLVCRGDNKLGQLDVPPNNALEYSQLALGARHSCAIRKNNGSVVCWGGDGEYNVSEIQGVHFESIVSGSNFTCGLVSLDFSIMCWGPGWSNGSGARLPLGEVLPGPCVQSSCSECGLYPQSGTLCSGSGNICKPCGFNASRLTPVAPPPLPSAPPPSIVPKSSPSKELKTGLLVFAIVGSVGGFAGLCTIIYCLWTGVCFGKKKVHNSVQPTITRDGSNGGMTSNNSGLISRSSTIRRQSSRAMRRQRSGTSSKHADRAEDFSFAELAAATNNFSLENKIGAGSFGVVYRGKLRDGREVAIKRGETGQKMKKFQEKEKQDYNYRPPKAAGTVGYIDPEYYGLNVLTAKSDVYGLGVVLLELLTGKRAIFKSGDNGGTPTSIVDFAVPKIMVNELGKILDPRVGPPEPNEAEAVELVGYTAMHSVNLEGKDRPTMTDIVANLERALSLCDVSHGSISSGTISIVSD
ncbi:SERINE/THREONINE-PROTEIN KINASE-LIKE PROTEIN CCR4 [Salix viminalis]|uniref:SERINE/THREONINE-PROTEIN KINASE-LIKE PROTEIN CCR4 n=1 Tax=Salix viminalis TaxID=40686 RepID=A0A9Q0TZC2_SALVM|nr:SERINE/THREONINE-PROTEIN KINASE-LIKE PROTEIN CCR4 [Salix viminalis]